MKRLKLPNAHVRYRKTDRLGEGTAALRHWDRRKKRNQDRLEERKALLGIE